MIQQRLRHTVSTAPGNYETCLVLQAGLTYHIHMIRTNDIAVVDHRSYQATNFQQLLRIVDRHSYHLARITRAGMLQLGRSP